MTTADLVKTLDPAAQRVADTAFRYGWAKATANALQLAVRYGPDNDYRLRRALLDAMDECPDLTNGEAK